MKEEASSSSSNEANKEEPLINSLEKTDKNLEKENISPNILSRERERKSLIICLSISITIIIICSILGARSAHKNNLIRKELNKDKENSLSSNKILLKYYNSQIKEYKLFDSSKNNISSYIHSIKIDNKTIKINSNSIQKYNFSTIGEHNLELNLNNNISSLNMLFKNCDSLISVDFTYFNSDNIDNMAELFSECSLLESINFTNFNTSRVIKMNYMFYQCESLTSLDLNNFETQMVDDMSSIFYGCRSLKFLDIENFCYNITMDYNDMFYNISKEGTVIYRSNRFFLPLKEFENWKKKDLSFVD